MSEAVEAACATRYRESWPDMAPEAKELARYIEQHTIRAADAARAASDEEVAKAIGKGRDGTDYYWKEFVEDARHLRAAGLKVVRDV